MRLPGERLDRRLGAAGAEREMWVKLLERNAAGGRFVSYTAEEERLVVLEARMREQQAGELAAGITADPGYGGVDGARVWSFGHEASWWSVRW